VKDHLKIYRFAAENVKRLQVVQITPNGNIIKVSGKNGAGKSSVLDAIEYLLRGTTNVPSKVIREGKRSATIQGDIGDFIITRKFTDSGRTTLQIMSKADRSFYASPQELLDGLMGKMSFDPLEFIRMKGSDQFKVLRKIVDVDLDSFDADYKRDYDLRRDVKKEYLAIEVRRDAIAVQPDLPLERRDEEALTKEMAEVAQYNETIDRERQKREKVASAKEQIRQQVVARAGRIEAIRLELEQLEADTVRDRQSIENIEREEKTWKKLPEPKNARDLADQLNAARIVNAAIVKREQRDALQAEIDALKERHAALSASLDAITAARTAAIASVHFPVDGLGFGEDEVLWQGLPFNQVSNADQIRASVAIGMAMNPRLRVMRIKDGSLLDSSSMAIVAELAKDQDFQIWMEVVDESGKVGIYLEEGEVKAVNDESEVPEKPERDMRIDLPMPGAKTVEQLEPPIPAKGKRGPKKKEKA
jgi:ABC-type cobalamin/Fe3+-siderophores transport system ATPase subunit